MTISYEIGDKLYINITNECNNACVFCIRNGNSGINGHSLWLEREPSDEEILEDIGKRDLSKYSEVVFCGFGEPLYRLETIIKVGKYLKDKGAKVRVNTNGQASLLIVGNQESGIDPPCRSPVNNHLPPKKTSQEVAMRLSEVIDSISISLNAPNAKRYNEVCVCKFGEAGFESMLEFAKECVKYIGDVTLSVVGLNESETEECRKIAESVGAKFRYRAR